jgi:hypothetical protein
MKPMLTLASSLLACAPGLAQGLGTGVVNAASQLDAAQRHQDQFFGGQIDQRRTGHSPGLAYTPQFQAAMTSNVSSAHLNAMLHL